MKRVVLIIVAFGFLGCGGTFASGGESGGAGGASGSSNPDASMGGSGVGGATGGAAGGGASDAGSAGGGAAGTGGSGGTGGRAGMAGGGGVADSGSIDSSPTLDATPVGTCKTDSDCRLGASCCDCRALAPGGVLPPCSLACIQSACAAMGIKGVRCSQGACVLAAECDTSVVTCRSVPPPCAVGDLPSIQGSCWSGHCVKASACRTVKDCTSCPRDLYLCAREEAQLGSTFRCVDLPPACRVTRTCECAGSYVCTPPFSSCSVNGDEFSCTCPTC
jgi:hypothetical protein